MLKEVFKYGTDGLIKLREGSPRRLIYCQSCKQCSLIFNMFCLELGSAIYKVGGSFFT